MKRFLQEDATDIDHLVSFMRRPDAFVSETAQPLLPVSL
jgi:hypothetical protein